MDELMGAAMFAALVDAGFLRQTKSGAFVRAHVV